jgi:hypothetical protein
MSDAVARPEPVTCLLSPLALNHYAKDFLRAGSSLEELPNGTFSPVQHYLFAHAIELALKAFLRASGLSMKLLGTKEYGHNLARLLSEAESRDLLAAVSLKPEHRAEIRRADGYYSEKLFEYPNLGEMLKGYPQKPDPALLRNAAEVLAGELEAVCLEAS